MKNLLTKMLFVSLLSSAVIPSGVQASSSTVGGKKFDVVLGAGVGTVAGIILSWKRSSFIEALALMAGGAAAGVGTVGSAAFEYKKKRSNNRRRGNKCRSRSRSRNSASKSRHINRSSTRSSSKNNISSRNSNIGAATGVVIFLYSKNSI